MLAPKTEARFFETQKAKLLRTNPGHFAVVCGRRLLGVYATLDLAVAAVAQGFNEHDIPVGTPILITEIAEEVSLRVVAEKGPSRVATHAAAL